IYPGFWAVARSNPTVDWLPLTKWDTRSMTMGSDSFLNLLRWKEVKRLVRSLSEIFIAPRQLDLSQIKLTTEKLLDFNPSLIVTLLPQHDFEHLSSSTIRDESE